MDVVEDIFYNPTRKPRVHVPNVLPTHPTLHLDSDFTLSSDSLGSDLVVYFPFGTRNKIFDPGIFREFQSKRFLSPNKFSISFIRDSLSLVFDTLLPFSSENEEKDFNPGSLSSNEAKYPLFAYVVWIFLPFLMYPVAPPYLLSSKNEDTIFDPDISIYHSFMSGVTHRMFDTLLPFSSKNEGNMFNPDILASNEEKSPHLLSYRGFKAFQLISESPMMISRGDIPILDVRIARIVKTRAHGFVLRSLELQILNFIMGIQYPNLID
ncbi:hypothetical protein Tco_1494012 [Tanacetum coccineum]